MSLVSVPRDLLLACRGEIRAWSGHWADGFTALGESLVQHDRRMSDGSCLSCSLLEILDHALHGDGDPPPPPAAAEPGVRVTEVVDMASRRRSGGYPLGRRP